MSEQEQQSPAPQKHRSVSRAKAAGEKRPAKTSTTVQTASTLEPPSQFSPPEPRIGMRWGEFPASERQAELEQRLQAWNQESDHGKRPGPFANFTLTGADAFWLAAWVVGEGDIRVGRKRITGDFLDRVFLHNLHLEGANLRRAQLQGAFLFGVQLQGANLSFANLQEAILFLAQLQEADLSFANLQEAILQEVHLQGADLSNAQLQGADLRKAHLQGTNLDSTRLQGAQLSRTQLQGANLSRAQLSEVNLREATLDLKTQLTEAHLDATVQVADLAWNGVPLIRVAWEQVLRLGDEEEAHQKTTMDLFQRKKRPKKPNERLNGYQDAVRAYRQLALTLRGQGIIDAADRFTYRALIMQRKALWWQLRARAHLVQPKAAFAFQHRTVQEVWHWLKGLLTLVPLIGSYLFSLFLANLTGYGFRMSRIIVAYALLILAFGGAYWGLDRHAHDPLNFGQALIVSITAFHGRVFSYNPFTLSDPQIVLTAIEAICGLVIEGLFVAMLVQRFFNR